MGSVALHHCCLHRGREGRWVFWRPGPRAPRGWGGHLTDCLACTRDSLGVADLVRPGGTGGQGRGLGARGPQPSGARGAAASLLDPASSPPNVVASRQCGALGVPGPPRPPTSDTCPSQAECLGQGPSSRPPSAWRRCRPSWQAPSPCRPGGYAERFPKFKRTRRKRSTVLPLWAPQGHWRQQVRPGLRWSPSTGSWGKGVPPTRGAPQPCAPRPQGRGAANPPGPGPLLASQAEQTDAPQV